MADIRAYKADDLEGLLTAWENATRLAHPFFSEEFIASERKAISEIYIPMTVTHVAVEDGAVAGFISLMNTEIGAIFVHPAHQKKGLGRALIDHAGKGHDALEVEVFEKNEIGRPFYDHYGFVGMRRTVHEATGETLIRMRWERVLQPSS